MEAALGWVGGSAWPVAPQTLFIVVDDDDIIIITLNCLLCVCG